MSRLRTVLPGQSATGSVMTRSMDGVIRFWDHAAKDLYGWKKEEAVGRVSHDLLKTEFPKPLDEIGSDLVRNGRWEGKLIHATRNGSRVVVESRWILRRDGRQETVVEINAPLAADRMDSHRGATDVGFSSRREPLPEDELAGGRSRLPRSALQRFLLAAAVAVPLAWLLYFLFGRLLISAIYSGELSWIADRLMAGRAFTAIENYYYEADQLFFSATSAILISALAGWLVLRNLTGAMVAAVSAFLCSFALFWVVENFPSLVRTLHLDAVSPYFATRANFVYDEQLVFRERPFNQGFVHAFRGANYSPLYEIDVPPWTVEWKTDRNGFRNSLAGESADLVVVGDSYMEYGPTEAKTFAGRLNEKLPGLRVANLGKSGYGPMQYVEVLKRYGTDYKPRYALLAFYEGNDILDIHNYRMWKAGKLEGGEPTYFIQERNLFGRYSFALQATLSQLIEWGFLWVHSAMAKSPLLPKTANNIHPDVAVVEVGGRTEKMLIADSFTRLQEAIRERENWAALERAIRNFNDIAAAQQITPIFVYIPSQSRIYAQFSTYESGANWLAIRDREISRREEVETAVARLVQSAGIDFVSLTPVLEREAQEGKMLYLQLDPHWNDAGTEIAATYVADYLKGTYLESEHARATRLKTHSFEKADVRGTATRRLLY